MDIHITGQFKKDQKKIKSHQRRDNIAGRLGLAIEHVCQGIDLPEDFRDHELIGDYIGFRECHLLPDMLLIYRVDEKAHTLTLTRLGRHSEIFG